MEIRERIRELRRANGLTQAEVAEKIGVSRHTYLNYESGYTKPKSKKLYAIADIYGLSVDDLLSSEMDDYIDYSHTKEFKRHKMLGSDERFLLYMFGLLNETDQRTVVDRARWMLENRRI